MERSSSERYYRMYEGPNIKHPTEGKVVNARDESVRVKSTVRSYPEGVALRGGHGAGAMTDALYR